MAAVTICSDFGAQKNKVWHCFPIYFPWSGGTGCEARGGGREDQPHVQGAVAVWAQEGLEELSHIEGQEGR